MKIPVLDGPQVDNRPVGTPYSNLRADTGSIAQGLTAVGEGAEKFGNDYTKAKAQADAVRADSADLSMGHLLNDGLHGKDGYLNKQGEQALDTETRLKQFQAQQERIAARLANDEQRRMFQRKADSRLSQVSATMEAHAARARRQVEEGVAKGQVELSQKDAETDPDNAESHALKLLVDPDGGPGPVRRQLMGSGAPSEMVEATERAARGNVYGSAVDSLLRSGEFERAEKLLEQEKVKNPRKAGQSDLEPAQARSFEKRILELKTNQRAERTSKELVDGARDPATGWVDAAKAERAIDDTPEGPLRDEVRQRVLRRLQLEEGQKKDDIARGSKGAYAEFNEGGFPAIKNKAWLNEHNPELYDRLKNDAERKRRQAKMDDAEARRQQAELNRIALLDLMSRSPEERAKLDLELQYGGTGVNEVGMGALKVRQRGALESVQKGEAVGEDDFVQQARARAQGLVKEKTTAAKEFDAELRTSYGDFVQEKKRAPSREEAKKIVGDLLEETITKKSLFGADSLWPDKKELEFKRRARARKEGAAGSPAAAPVAPATSATPAGPAAKAAPSSSKRKPPGRYRDRVSGKVVVVDDLGNMRFE